MAKLNVEKNRDDEIVEALTKLVYDPLAFVYWAYPWKQPGTFLVDEDGPDKWQKDVLNEVGDLLRAQANREEWKGRDIGNVIQYAIKAGRDPGKTALIAWIVHFFISTRPNCRGIVTANTKVQLESTTWREIAKWHDLSIHKHWFEHNASRFTQLSKPKTWYITPVIWSEERPQAVAGVHEKYVIVIFDEASEISDVIWETIEGGLTDPYCFWLAAGNPTKTEGRFFECFDKGKFSHRWIQKTIDSREAKRPDKEKIRQWIEDYGDDSDYVRVWVKGEFPRMSLEQFISPSIVDEAMGRKHDPEKWRGYPKIMGVDVARHGDDRNCIVIRQGRQIREINKFPGKIESLMVMVGHCIRKIEEWRPQAVFIDVGMGYGVIDRLRELGYQNVFEVNFGMKASREKEYHDKRAEIWGLMKKWLIEDGAIPQDEDLKRDLVGPQYGFDHRQRVQLERKKEMKGRGLPSPDAGDALAVTFALPLSAEIYTEKSPAQQVMDFVEGKTKIDFSFGGGQATTYIDFGG